MARAPGHSVGLSLRSRISATRSSRRRVTRLGLALLLLVKDGTARLGLALLLLLVDGLRLMLVDTVRVLERVAGLLRLAGMLGVRLLEGVMEGGSPEAEGDGVPVGVLLLLGVPVLEGVDASKARCSSTARGQGARGLCRTRGPPPVVMRTAEMEMACAQQKPMARPDAS